MKTKEMIGFRPSDPKTLQRFLKWVQELDVTQAALAEEAFILGLPNAVEQLKQRKLSEAESLILRLKNIQGDRTPCARTSRLFAMIG